jgi:protein-tyrosine phosphatase
MWSYYDYLTAGMKVVYDKTTDYALYYTGYGDYDKDREEVTINDDVIENYNGLLRIETYKDEKNNKRILEPVGYYDEYTTFFSQPTHIIDNIYLGSAFNAANYGTLKDHNIKVIINVTTEISEYFPDEFTYLRYKLYDNNKHSIKHYLEQSYDDIKHHQQNTQGNILIHCFMGASRSASIVLYYLIRTKTNPDGTPMSFDDALNFLKSKRIVVNPTFKLTKDLASSVHPKLIKKED